MLIRIVRMTFEPEKVKDFLAVFNESKELIASSEGCMGVELLRDISEPNTFFTYSKWDSETHLNDYRSSKLFMEVWNNVRKWFAAKPSAWSVMKVE